MADKKITQLAELSILSNDDLVAGVDLDNNITSKIAISTLKDYIDTTYIGGEGVSIDGNVISANGIWGNITGNIENQVDLMQLIGNLESRLDNIENTLGIGGEEE